MLFLTARCLEFESKFCIDFKTRMDQTKRGQSLKFEGKGEVSDISSGSSREQRQHTNTPETFDATVISTVEFLLWHAWQFINAMLTHQPNWLQAQGHLLLAPSSCRVFQRGRGRDPGGFFMLASQTDAFSRSETTNSLLWAGSNFKIEKGCRTPMRADVRGSMRLYGQKPTNPLTPTAKPPWTLFNTRPMTCLCTAIETS